MKARLGLLIVPGVLSLLVCSGAVGQIYKQVDEQGHVTYTDQVPLDGSAPMDLPELSVIETDHDKDSKTDAVDGNAREADATETNIPTPREMRRMYRDFRITRPAQEESLWGTENMAVISWGSSTPLLENMTVRVFVDGQQKVTNGGDMIALKLDRGEHQVYAELLDARARSVVKTPTVTFFIKQYSANFNPSAPTPNSGP